MSASVQLPNVDRLSGDAVGVMPVDRDWSVGYPDVWEYLQAPSCLDCGGYAVWREPADVLDAATTDGQRAAILNEVDMPAWRCEETTCDRYGLEIERGDGGDEGPMMAYAYALPSRERAYDERDAERIAHLPLCIVRWETGGYELALTGGGEDLMWQICEAFALLGFAPPLHFCDLPGIAGKPDGPRDAFVMGACRRTLEIVRGRVERYTGNLDEMQGVERFPLATPANMRRAAQEAPDPARVAAWSPETGETFSATPGDYFALGDSEPVREATTGALLRLVATVPGTGARLVAPFDPAPAVVDVRCAVCGAPVVGGKHDADEIGAAEAARLDAEHEPVTRTD